MKIEKHRAVEFAISTLGGEDKKTVLAWLANLGNWENDEHTRTIAKPTPYKDVYALDTSDDLRIFFKLDIDRQVITIVDIAKPSRYAVASSTAE